MTKAERQAIESAVMQARRELDAFEERIKWMGLADLYDAAKPVHTSALGIWCAVVEVLRARKGLDLNTETRRQTDAINLNELFGEKENDCGNQPS